MSKLHELDLEEETPHSEITLGLSSLLGIFFAAVLVCGVFFGFGYTVGRSSMQKVIAAASNGNSSDTGYDSYKPAAGSPSIPGVTQDTTSAASGSTADTTSASGTAATPAEPMLRTQAPETTSAPAAASTAVPQAAPATATVANTSNATFTRTSAPVPTSASAPVPAVAAPSGPLMVQIAAVSHQEDANVLLSALRKRGYNVMAKPDLSDNLIHVQVGPFSNRKDANVMRQRLLADGYNAILK